MSVRRLRILRDAALEAGRCGCEEATYYRSLLSHIYRTLPQLVCHDHQRIIELQALITRAMQLPADDKANTKRQPHG